MQPDADLKKDVMAELAWDPAVNAGAIDLSVRRGLVCVSGHVDTLSQKHAVEQALRRVPGVKAIAMELQVVLPPAQVRSDAEIAAAAEHALRGQTLVQVDNVRLGVDHGCITLHGEVDWDSQRRSVEQLLRHLTGLTGLCNEIVIRQRPTPANVAACIEAALRRQAVRQAHRVQVEVNGSTVKLAGRVHSWQERDAAQGAAWAAPGVRCVINEIDVGP